MPALSKEAMLLDVETDFGLSLLRQTAVNQSVVLSPISIALALSLVHAGAKGNTKEQIQAAIAKGATDNEVVAHYSALCKALEKTSDGVDVRVANRMFMDNSLTVNEDYLADIKEHYDALAQTLNFRDATHAAEVVNGFVNETTKGKISKLLDPSSFAGAVAFLINAVYLKADWKHKFNKDSTEEGDFHVSPTSDKKVMFMKENKVPRAYYDDGNVEVLTLPYKDPRFAFTIFLPKQTHGLADFRSQLTGTKMQELINSTERTSVSLKIPRMKIETEMTLNEALKAIGIEDMFTGRADLSGIAGGLFVSEAKHKAVIETDEEGSVAAAATSIAMSRSLPRHPPPVVPFVADHPFVYAITLNGHVMFIGHFNG